MHATRSRTSRRPDRGDAFTLAELVIGLVVLAIIGGATAAVSLAVSRGWQAGESAATSNLLVTRTMLRVQDKLQRAKYIGEWRAGSVSAPSSVSAAAILIWRDDDNGDDKMQLEETQLLEYDPATRQLTITEPAFPNAATRAAYNGPFPASQLADPGSIDSYKTMTYRKRYAITNGVLGVAFNVVPPPSPSQRRIVEFTLKFRGAKGESLEYGTAVGRSTGT